MPEDITFRWDRLVFYIIVTVLLVIGVVLLWFVGMRQWWVPALALPVAVFMAVKLPLTERIVPDFPVPPHEDDKFDPISGETEAINATTSD